MRTFNQTRLALLLVASSALTGLPVLAQDTTQTPPPLEEESGQAPQQSEPLPADPGAAEAPAGESGTTPPEAPVEGEAPAEDGMTPESPDASTEPSPSGETGETAPADEAESETGTQEDQPAGGQDGSAGAADEAGDEPATGEPADDAATGGNEESPPDQSTDVQSSETNVEITNEQEVEITNVIQETDVEPVEVDFEVDIGVSVPETIVLEPLPPRIIEIVPAYKGYLFFILADGRIVIVEPSSHDVVYIIVV